MPYSGDDILYGHKPALELVDGVGNGASVLVQQFIEDLYGLFGSHPELENAVLQAFVQGRYDAEVKSAVGSLAGQVNVALDAGNPPEVLAFEV